MKELLGSQVKESLLLHFCLRGGASGRELSRILNKSPSQVFKALRQLQEAGVILKYTRPSLYALNSHYPYFEEVIRMAHKRIRSLDQFPPYLLNVPPERRVDPVSIYEILSLRPPRDQKVIRFSEALRYYDA